MFSAKVLADSVNVAGNRLTTMELQYPRFIHAELLTHRMFSRNSASSRAIPVEKLIQRVLDDPVIPLRWGKAQRGMVPGDELNPFMSSLATETWIRSRDLAIDQVRELLKLGCHKTLPNRLLEPWMWITVIVTATDWDNFFALRTAPTAEDHMRHLALMMRNAYEGSDPKKLLPGFWHLPLIEGLEHDEGPLDKIRASAGRCARVSYLTHDGKRDMGEDVRLCERLIEDKHLSPLEHPAMALGSSERVANFEGWVQYRRMIGY